MICSPRNSATFGMNSFGSNGLQKQSITVIYYFLLQHSVRHYGRKKAVIYTSYNASNVTICLTWI